MRKKELTIIICSCCGRFRSNIAILAALVCSADFVPVSFWALIRSKDRQSVIFDTTIQRRQGAGPVCCGQRLLGGESAENLCGSRHLC